MTLGETKRHLTTAYTSLSNGESSLVVHVGGRWKTYFAGDGKSADILLVRRFVEWLITICGSDADARETMDVVCEHPKFKKHHKGETFAVKTHKAMIRIAKNKAGYSILKAILASKSGQDSAEQGQKQGQQDQGTDGENIGQGLESQDLQNPDGGNQETEDSDSDNPQGEGDSTQSNDPDGCADRDTETDSPSSLKISPQAFWPEDAEVQLDAAGRQAARLLFQKIKQYSGGGQTQVPLISPKKLVKELVSQRYNLSRIRSKAITKPKKTLICVDVSGSCSAHSANTNAAAKAVYEAAPELVVIIWHVNGIYKTHLGELPELPIGEVLFYSGHKYTTLAWWEIKWGLIVSFGDSDSAEQEIHACNNGTTVLKMDSYRKHVTGFKHIERYYDEYLENSAGRFIYCQGCDNASDLVQGLRLL